MDHIEKHLEDHNPHEVKFAERDLRKRWGIAPAQLIPEPGRTNAALHFLKRAFHAADNVMAQLD